jgi:hypothetical protein
MTYAGLKKSADEIADLARERAGLTEFASDSWREGLEILLGEIDRSPTIVDAGRKFLYRQYADALWNRLRVDDYVRRHPEVLDEQVERPLVILGMPRTGTTVASCLLDQDPRRRSLLNWEAVDSVPPPTTATLCTDPRCVAKLAQQRDLAAALVAAGQGFPHWEDADGPTECIFVQAQDFKAFVWDAWMTTSVYSDWLLDCDMTSAYAYEKRVLQILQSQAPGTWSLKMPSHAVHIDTLLATFPDVRMIWAHRDPYKATASLCSIGLPSKLKVTGGNVDRAWIGRNSVTQMQAHVDRAMRARARVGDDRFYDLYYANMMRDPVGEMHKIYEWAGDELTPDVEIRMRQWLTVNPQDRFGSRPYSLDEYGLTREQLEPVFADYLAAFDVELEA